LLNPQKNGRNDVFFCANLICTIPNCTKSLGGPLFYLLKL
jgi:hypothetical protein